MFWLCFIFYNNTISYQMQGKKKGLLCSPFLISYSMISVTTPAPTVLPPSRIANRNPSSIAICVISLIVITDVVSGHYHLYPFRQLDYPRYIRRSEVKLRSVSIEERRMSSALFFLQYVYLPFEVRMRMNRSRRCQYLSALNLVPLNPTQQRSDVVPCYCFIQQLPEHLYARYHRRLLLFAQPYDLYRILYLHRSAFYAPRCYRATTRDREYVLYRHQERLVAFTFRRRNVRCLPLPSIQRSLCTIRRSLRLCRPAPLPVLSALTP